MTSVVMIPGLGSDGAVWDRTIEALGADANCQVGDTLSDDSLAGMAQRILAAAPPRFVLAGVSMGGMVALEIMRAAPARVTHLALVDTNAKPDTPEAAERRRQTNAVVAAASDFLPMAKGSLAYLVHPDSVPEVGEALVAMSMRVGPAAYVRQNEAVVARGDLQPILATIRVPTFVIVGEQDAMTPLPMSEAIRDGISGATLHIIPNCGHLPPIEKPQAVADLLRRLVSQDR